MTERIEVRRAVFKRLLERADRLCADVEVTTEGKQGGRLVALFVEEAENDYKLVSVLRNDAELETDWYDNNLHDAYEEVTDQLFAGQAEGEAARKAFESEVLAFGDVRARIREALAEAKEEASVGKG